MLLFIERKFFTENRNYGFNTSHVVIYRRICILYPFVFQSFNTSHVVIYRTLVYPSHLPLLSFQYISCCYLSVVLTTTTPLLNLVSIHLMLLFIGLGQMVIDFVFDVSIHLMLLFIKSAKKAVERGKKVSIHLMLLFILRNYFKHG